jgi:hypothetical protein
MSCHRAITAKAKEMKKNPNSSDLAAKIAAAARQPAGARTVSPPVLVSPPAGAKPVVNEPAKEPTRAKEKSAKPKDPDTVPITLRPSSELLNKFVLKAAERTREEGRVVSAQQIMLEALERNVL